MENNSNISNKEIKNINNNNNNNYSNQDENEQNNDVNSSDMNNFEENNDNNVDYNYNSNNNDDQNKDEVEDLSTKILDYFALLSQEEANLDLLRNKITSHENFNFNKLYKYLAENNEGPLTLTNFKKFLDSFEGLEYEDEALRKLIHLYDRNNDFALDIKEFYNMFFPGHKYNYTNEEENEETDIHDDIIQDFINLILQELSVLQSAIAITDEIRDDLKFNPYEEFRRIAVNDSDKYIDSNILAKFLNNYGMDNINADKIIWRLDTDGDNKISYDEFLEIFAPSKVNKDSNRNTGNFKSSNMSFNNNNNQKSKNNYHNNYDNDNKNLYENLNYKYNNEDEINNDDQNINNNTNDDKENKSIKHKNVTKKNDNDNTNNINNISDVNNNLKLNIDNKNNYIDKKLKYDLKKETSKIINKYNNYSEENPTNNNVNSYKNSNEYKNSKYVNNKNYNNSKHESNFKLNTNKINSKLDNNYISNYNYKNTYSSLEKNINNNNDDDLLNTKTSYNNNNYKEHKTTANFNNRKKIDDNEGNYYEYGITNSIKRVKFSDNNNSICKHGRNDYNLNNNNSTKTNNNYDNHQDTYKLKSSSPFYQTYSRYIGSNSNIRNNYYNSNLRIRSPNRNSGRFNNYSLTKYSNISNIRTNNFDNNTFNESRRYLYEKYLSPNKHSHSYLNNRNINRVSSAPRSPYRQIYSPYRSYLSYNCNNNINKYLEYKNNSSSKYISPPNKFSLDRSASIERPYSPTYKYNSLRDNYNQKNTLKASNLAYFLSDITNNELSYERLKEELSINGNTTLDDIFNFFSNNKYDLELSIIDLREGLLKLNILVNIDQCKYLFKRFDRDCDGKLK